MNIYEAITQSRVVNLEAGSYTFDQWETPEVNSLTLIGHGGVTLQGPDVDFLRMKGGHVRVEGCHFTGWRWVLFSMARHGGSIEIVNCTYEGCDAPLMDAGTQQLGKLDRLIVRDCRIERCKTGIMGRHAEIDHAGIENNIIRDIGGEGAVRCVGMQIAGGETRSGGVRIVSGNVVENIITDQQVEAHGILVYGEGATIRDNRVVNVFNADHARGEQSEGIYTKAQNAIIDHNRVINACGGEGAICCKGKGPDDEPTAPRGDGVTVANNLIEWDPALLPFDLPDFRPRRAIYLLRERGVAHNNQTIGNVGAAEVRVA